MPSLWTCLEPDDERFSGFHKQNCAVTHGKGGPHTELSNTCGGRVLGFAALPSLARRRVSDSRVGSARTQPQQTRPPRQYTRRPRNINESWSICIRQRSVFQRPI